MNDKTRKSFVACALGTMIGLFFAIKITPLFWWFGVLVGGFASGFLYLLPGLAGYVPTAARLVCRTLAYLPRRIWGGIVLICRKMRDAPSVRKWEAASIIMFVVLFVAFCLGLVPAHALPAGLEKLYISLGIVYLLVVDYTLVSGLVRNNVKEAVRIRRAQKAIILATPIGPFYLFIKIFILVCKVIRRAILILARITIKVFIFLLTVLFSLVATVLDIAYLLTWNTIFVLERSPLILCFVDGGFGVVISYLLFTIRGDIRDIRLAPALLLGGLIGGLLGVVDYKAAKRLRASKIQ